MAAILRPAAEGRERIERLQIRGREFQVGKVDHALRKQAEPCRRLVEEIHTRGEDPNGEDASRAKAQIAALLLRQDAPDISAEWVRQHMTPGQRELLFDEFLRQAVELVVGRPSGVP